MVIAASWYENDSVWAGAGVGVAMIALIVGAWATLRAAYPVRRLTYELRSSAPLVQRTGHLGDSLTVSLGGTRLADPHVLHIELVNRGRRDIPSAAFDSGAPIQLELGARVTSVLEVVSEPAHSAAPSVSVSGQALSVGPGLFTRRQRVTISVLVDGPEPDLRISTALIDVHVRHYDSSLETRRSPPGLALLLLGTFLTILGGGPVRDVLGEPWAHNLAVLGYGVGTGGVLAILWELFIRKDTTRE